MQYFDSVVIACDDLRLDCALAVRSALEAFRLRVHLYHCVQKQNLLDVLSGNIPESDYIVLFGGGTPGSAVPESEVVLQLCGLVDNIDGIWQSVDVPLNPSNVQDLVKLEGKTVITLGCRTGTAALANAFLNSGCKAYIGPDGEVNGEAVVMFTIGFFYHLLSSTRPKAGSCNAEEAVKRAGITDTYSSEGTHVFRYYTKG